MTFSTHQFPFRTQKLISLVPNIVGCTRPVKIGRCRLLSSIRLLKPQPDGHAPLAQLVEQLTLNQWAQGSSPWRCTTSTKSELFPIGEGFGFFIFLKKWNPSRVLFA